MVFLTMTPKIVEALEELQSLQREADEKTKNDGRKIEVEENQEDRRSENITEKEQEDGETRVKNSLSDAKEDVQGSSTAWEAAKANEQNQPSLWNPKLGNPISHGQVIDLWKESKDRGPHVHSLDTLLRGSRVYVPPPKSKPEPTSEYKALMARLRREEEARSYHRMTNPPPPMETFAQHFPLSSSAHAFSSNQLQSEEDEVTYSDVDRQMALVLNVLISIVACAAAIWIAAKWWSTPARLAVSFGGSLLVGVAEVVVYSGYVRRVGESKGKEKQLKEVKEVMRTWVVGAGEDEEEGDRSVTLEAKDPDSVKARRRKKDIR